jgi:hypothetical protein
MSDAELDPAPILTALYQHEVDFVVIGGLAGLARGSRYPTDDTEVAYARAMENLERLATALRELEASLRGAPPDVPIVLDANTLAHGANFTFDTKFGPLDILGDPAGAPKYEALRQDGVGTTLFGVRVRVASLDHLIAMKEAAGRPRDLIAASEYRVISDELRRPKAGSA